jgi:putative hydroxymethylpyrimidine transport system substrate-binding protein
MRLLIGLLTAFTFACTALPAAAQDKVRLLLDWFVNPDHAALVIAKQRGIFTRHGLEVELIAPADPNAPPKLVAAGQADYAVSYQPTLQMLAAEGLPLVRVG